MTKPGQRDENSVMFSLSALVAREAESKAEKKAEAERQTNDESGLIDLKALAAARQKPVMTDLASPGDAGLFPFDMPAQPAAAPPPPVAAPAVAQGDADDLPKKGSKAVPIVAGIAALCVMGLVFVIVMKGGGGGTALNADSSLNSAARNVRATLKFEAPPPPDPAQATAAVTPGASTAKTAAPVAQRGPSQPGKANPAPGPKPGPAPGPAPAPAPAPAGKDNCGGDLMCAMQRAAKK
jgi:hypothetical protein